jgi:hypothetical protein
VHDAAQNDVAHPILSSDRPANDNSGAPRNYTLRISARIHRQHCASERNFAACFGEPGAPVVFQKTMLCDFDMT